MSDTFYIESGTGRQVSDLSTVDPSKFYIQSGTGTSYSGSSLAPTTSTSTAPQPYGANVPALPGSTTVAPPSIPSTISSPSLTTSTPTPYVTPPTPSPYPVSSLPDVQLTPTQTEAQGLTTDLQKLYDESTGKSAYQTQENTAFGVDAAQKSITDLGAQLTGLKNEAAAIPLQLQQGAAERGVTTPVLGAQEESRLRTNAIAALGVSTLMAASQGQLANAQRLADEAVARKYDPIQEQITAKLHNLQLILNSPQATLDEKRQAAQMTMMLEAQKAQVTQAKTTATDVWKVATDAASNIQNFTPSAQYKTAAQALQAISQASDPQTALQIAASTGLTTSGTPKILGSASSGYFQYDPATGQVTPISGGSGGTTSTYQAGMLTTLLQSQGKTADDATLKSLWSQYGNGGTYTNDTAHNSIIYKAMGGSTSTASTYKFTPTQLNSGASKAGMTLDEFKASSPDVQNYFVNKSATELKAITDLFAEVSSGTKTAAEVKALIDSSPNTQAVKDYWDKKLQEITTSSSSTSTSGGGLLQNIWSGITGFLGY